MDIMRCGLSFWIIFVVLSWFYTRLRKAPYNLRANVCSTSNWYLLQDPISGPSRPTGVFYLSLFSFPSHLEVNRWQPRHCLVSQILSGSAPQSEAERQCDTYCTVICVSLDVLCGRVPAEELERCHAGDRAPYKERSGCRMAVLQSRWKKNWGLLLGRRVPLRSCMLRPTFSVRPLQPPWSIVGKLWVASTCRSTCGGRRNECEVLESTAPCHRS